MMQYFKYIASNCFSLASKREKGKKRKEEKKKGFEIISCGLGLIGDVSLLNYMVTKSSIKLCDFRFFHLRV